MRRLLSAAAIISTGFPTRPVSAFAPSRLPSPPSLLSAQNVPSLSAATAGTEVDGGGGSGGALLPQEPSPYRPPDASTATVAKRAAEVGRVAVLDLALPLVASAAQFASKPLPGQERGWDTFWSLASDEERAGGEGTSPKAITNADRVASALERLGPTFVKFGQAISSRPDIVPPSLATSLSRLQDNMESFDTVTAKGIVIEELLGRVGEREKNGGGSTTVIDDRWYDGSADVFLTEETVRSLVDSLSEEPVAAASIGQVYKGVMPGFGTVAVKVRRPQIDDTVKSDFALLRTLATLIESIPALSSAQSSSDGNQQDRLIATELVAAIDEFMGRLLEELDFYREADNARRFASLYSIRGPGSAVDGMPDVNGKGVVVPEFLPDLCTGEVIVMEWIEGTKLTEVTKGAAGEAGDSAAQRAKVQENLLLIELATEYTLSQLLDTGVLHADPHGGNLLKVPVDQEEGAGEDCGAKYRLAYLDFGIVSSVPPQVRDGLVCAVAQLVFAGDVDAVADLFGELQLIPQEILDDPYERSALRSAMRVTLSESLKYPEPEPGRDDTQVPVLLFDKLLDALSRLVPRFRFDLPPYFINNARALSTLEGIARTLDPEFNVLQVMYPTALNRMLQNPTRSPVVERTLQSLIRSAGDGAGRGRGRIDRGKVSKLLRDSALLTGLSRGRILRDALGTRGGRRIARSVLAEGMTGRMRLRRSVSRRGGGEERREERRRRPSPKSAGRRRLSDYLRL